MADPHFSCRLATKYICIHCSATPPSMDIGADEIRSWHQARGWIDIGYHAVIRRSGTLCPGRPADVVGAHEPKINRVAYAVCLVGGVDESGRPVPDFTVPQWQALHAHVEQMLIKFPDAAVVGHNQFAVKACPSFQVPEWWRSGAIVPVL